MSIVTPFSERPLGSTLVLFGACLSLAAAQPATKAERDAPLPRADVDGTLTPARRTASPEILEVLKALRQKAVIGFVGGSDLPKITEQLAVHGQDSALSFRFRWA